MIDIGYHEIIGAIAFLISVTGSLIYIRSIFKGETHPHIYTWLVWGIITSIAFFAQLHENAGPGAWTIGITAFFCMFTAGLALKYDEKNITKSDTIALIASLSAIAPWILTNDPLWSVILASLIDIIAFFPTIRKSWNKPYGENLPSYHIANLKMGLSLIALTNFSLTTMLYPLAVILVNLLLILICLWRRREIPKPV